MGILPRFFLGLAAAAMAVAQQPPYLFLRLVTPAGTQVLAPNQVVQVKNSERIRLQVCIRARSVADRFEQPAIQAVNQAPGYFQNRPGPNITLSIKRIAGNDALQPSVRVVQAPIFHGHAFSLHLEMEQPVALGDLSQALAGDHVTVARQTEDSPSNVNAAGQGDVLVSLARDDNHPNGVWIWAAADNLRIAAATAVECAETMTPTRPRGKIQ